MGITMNKKILWAALLGMEKKRLTLGETKKSGFHLSLHTKLTPRRMNLAVKHLFSS